MLPTRKVGAVGAAGAISILLVLVLRRYQIELSAEESQAVTLLLSFASGYFMPDKALPETIDSQAPS